MSHATEIKDDILALKENPLDAAAVSSLQDLSRELHGTPEDASKRGDDVLRRVDAQKELDKLTEDGIIPRVQINSDGFITFTLPNTDHDPSTHDVMLVNATPKLVTQRTYQLGGK
jgi:hypothetical protein